MKKIFFLLIAAFLIHSCEQYCDCPSDNCEPLDCNLLYTGFWTAESNCSNADFGHPHTITINESSNCIQTTIYNFLGDGEIVTIEFGTHSIIIPEQPFDQYDNIFGTGFLNGDTLKITFTLKDKTFDWEDLCELVAIKDN